VSAPPPSSPARAWFALALVFSAHVLCVSYFTPPSVLLGEHPLSGSDYDTHIEQTWRVIEGLQGWGQTWVYDVNLLAGHPNGVIFDADNKAWEYLTYGLVQLGVRRALAFNTFVILAHLLLVPLIYASARLFGSTRAAAVTAAALGSGLWLFDSYTHWIWWVGTIAFAFASYFALLPLSLFYRYLQDRRILHATTCAISLGLGLLVHPYTFFVLVVPMGLLYLRSAQSVTRREHLAVAAIVAVALGINAEWLLQSLAQWHYVLDSAFFGHASHWQLPADFFGVLLDTATTGISPTRTSVRFLCFAGAAVTLAHYARTKDTRFAPLTAAITTTLVFGYGLTWWHWALQVQPYRFVGAAAFLAVLPAADLVTLVRKQLQWRTLPKVAQGAALVLGLLTVQHVGRDIVSFFPGLLPKVPPLLDGVPSPVTASGYPPFAEYRHLPDHPVFWELSKWVKQHDNGHGRFLVQTGAIGEQLAWKTDAEILGGFTLRNVEHVYANLFRRKLERNVTAQEARTYLEAYAVQWVILTFPDAWFASMPELFEKHAEVAGNVILRTKVPVSRFQRGHGIISADTNRILVQGTEPSQDIVLRYHFHEQLACSPACRIERSPNPAGGVPFIRVPAPHPANFAILNTYGERRN
jgi:hypothetical protein